MGHEEQQVPQSYLHGHVLPIVRQDWPSLGIPLKVPQSCSSKTFQMIVDNLRSLTLWKGRKVDHSKFKVMLMAISFSLHPSISIMNKIFSGGLWNWWRWILYGFLTFIDSWCGTETIQVPCWKPGDIIALLLDLNNQVNSASNSCTVVFNTYFLSTKLDISVFRSNFKVDGGIFSICLIQIQYCFRSILWNIADWYFLPTEIIISDEHDVFSSS